MQATVETQKPIHIISLGAGVQSSTMSLMAAHGEITPMPVAAIFADTQAEPKSVYTWLDWLEKQLPFPVYRVTTGNLAVDELRIRRSKKSGRLYLRNTIPAFVSRLDGRRGLLGRKCTADYKIIPLQRKVKELVGIRRSVNQVRSVVWIGISRDEAHRMKPSRVPYIENSWPLIDANMTRQKCLEWWDRPSWYEARPFKYPPRSACRFCPFHSDEEWDRQKTEEPDEFALSVAFERDLIVAAKQQETLIGTPFLHESCTPLDSVDFTKLLSSGRSQLSLFGNECEGMCGV